MEINPALEISLDQRENFHGRGKAGTDVVILISSSPKYLTKILTFFRSNYIHTASFYKKNFAENRQKSPKIVITTSTPEHKSC
jgi:hypothetical protein